MVEATWAEKASASWCRPCIRSGMRPEPVSGMPVAPKLNPALVGPFLLLAAGEMSMKQEHTEETVKHTDTQQNTGNHKKPGAPDERGADRFGGTRTGAENVEKKDLPEGR
jgi:hypothetical protein